MLTSQSFPRSIIVVNNICGYLKYHQPSIHDRDNFFKHWAGSLTRVIELIVRPPKIDARHPCTPQKVTTSDPQILDLKRRVWPGSRN
ncbi:hypothetical protein TMatcc_002257 [Talaromyces marneffei ATCC 18224]